VDNVASPSHPPSKHHHILDKSSNEHHFASLDCSKKINNLLQLSELNSSSNVSNTNRQLTDTTNTKSHNENMTISPTNPATVGLSTINNSNNSTNTNLVILNNNATTVNSSISCGSLVGQLTTLQPLNTTSKKPPNCANVDEDLANKKQLENVVGIRTSNELDDLSLAKSKEEVESVAKFQLTSSDLIKLIELKSSSALSLDTNELLVKLIETIKSSTSAPQLNTNLANSQTESNSNKSAELMKPNEGEPLFTCSNTSGSYFSQAVATHYQ
jgi:hypothetical protein